MLPPPAITKPKTPIALARSEDSVNRSTMSEKATADTTAPPSPRRVHRGEPRLRTRRLAGAGEEHPPLPDQVAEAPGEQEEAAEGEHVRVDYPGESGLREAEIAAGPARELIGQGVRMYTGLTVVVMPGGRSMGRGR